MQWTRRNCLKVAGGAVGAAFGAMAGPARMLAAQVSSKADSSKLAMPGLFRGRVIAVEHPGSIVDGRYQAEPVQQMMRKGMTDLTGAAGWVDAWRMFVEPGDIVGIKVNPVGGPLVVSAAEVVREIIAGLNAAGVKNKDIVVYDRYRAQFLKVGFDKWLPEGVRTSSAAEDYDDVQQAIEGYDPDHYMDMALTLPGYDIGNLTARRSYAAHFITKEVNKLINLPVLKDHQSAGVTLALKNLSHGLVNNVCRSHSSSTLNACGSFIPAVVSMPVIRNKTVLHVLDGVKGLYHGGPGARPQFVWEHKTIYFATDPVALDHICWKAIDEKRLAMGMKTIAEDRPDKYSTFWNRQPEHVEIAGAMGLGEWNESKIDSRRIKL
ncbi:MAG TPA: DUF362 domain-containing protein [Bryobacteraceae bacterium]|nr:DUF362 domain-containing protein [Bryobacteraceae bacterium]